MKYATLALFLMATPAMAAPLKFQPQVHGLRCLKPETRAVLSRIAHALGSITITSTCGGRHARHSRHYTGHAFDWRPPHGIAYRKAVRVAMRYGTGVGTYRSGIIHTDVGR